MAGSLGSFAFAATEERLAELGPLDAFVPDEQRRSFRGAELRVTPPLIAPIAADVTDLADYLDRLPPEPEAHLVILLQAGASALGYFRAGEPIATKSDKKYVVRGRGRAQPTHLATKGKSRYGSRLRLQNAQKLLDELSERIGDWLEVHGVPDAVFYNVPVRLWSDFFDCRPPPPIDRDAAIRIPLDVPVPTTATLLRTYKKMSYGRIERIDSS